MSLSTSLFPVGLVLPDQAPGVPELLLEWQGEVTPASLQLKSILSELEDVTGPRLISGFTVSVPFTGNRWARAAQGLGWLKVERPVEIQADAQSFIFCQRVDQEGLLSGSFHILHMGLILFGGDQWWRKNLLIRSRGAKRAWQWEHPSKADSTANPHIAWSIGLSTFQVSMELFWSKAKGSQELYWALPSLTAKPSSSLFPSATVTLCMSTCPAPVHI